MMILLLILIFINLHQICNFCYFVNIIKLNMGFFYKITPKKIHFIIIKEELVIMVKILMTTWQKVLKSFKKKS